MSSDSESEDVVQGFTNHPDIRKANEITSKNIQNLVRTPQIIKEQSYEFEVLLCSELSKPSQKEIWDILVGNMRDFYINSSFGWKPRKKRKELFHELSRFLLVRACPENSDDAVSRRHQNRPILAYSMFRFEHEDGRNVLYCYELQTHPNGRRKGLGKAIVAALEAICKGLGLSWILLTALTANDSAMKFYCTTGFILDESSPTSDDEYDIGNGEYEKYDYRILSKCVDSKISDADSQ